MLAEYKTPSESLNDRLRDYLRRHYSLEERLAAFAERRFYSLEIELTNTCNQECLYCYNWSRRTSTKPHTRLDDIKRWIQEARSAGIRELFWLGGEPLLYPHLESVLEHSASAGIANTLLTNGTFLTPTKWRRLKSLVQRLVFHLDTVDSRTFCTINNVERRQGQRLLVRAMENLEFIGGQGRGDLDIILYVVLLGPTLVTLEQTLEWALSGGLANTTALYPMVRAGRAKELPADWALSADEIRSAFQIRSEAEGRPELLGLGPSEYCKHYQLTMAYIDVEGRLSAYAGISDPTFSTAGEDLGTLLQRHYDELSFSFLGRPDPSEGLQRPCRGCCYGDLCFGTRTTAFNHLGSSAAADPFCWMNPKEGAGI